MIDITLYYPCVPIDCDAGAIPGPVKRATIECRRDAGREDFRAATAACPRLESDMQPDYRDLPLADVPHAQLVAAYQHAAVCALDFQSAGSVLLDVITGAAERLDAGDAIGARRLLEGPLARLREADRATH
jgi:hypothetical protein